MAELLLELLSEEIPARMQARAAEDLKRLAAAELEKVGLAFDTVETFVTPRRLALVVDGLPTRQPDAREEKRGPRVGAPQQAIDGFLKANGLAKTDQLEQRDGEKGTFWYAVIARKGRSTAEVLPGVIAHVLSEVRWLKSMRWGAHKARWVRPLVQILAVFNWKPLEFADLADGDGLVAAVPITNRTIGHRAHAPRPVAVRNFADYREKLRERYVVLDAAERRSVIEKAATALARKAQLSLRDDPALLDEVAGLVEWPVVLMGTIDEAFMDVPQEVLITSMRTHQRYFSLLKKDGALAPRFILVANTETRDGGKAVVAGNERVLRARLHDAKFFWDQDRRRTLESRVPQLGDIVFHARLGTLADKVARLQALAAELAPLVPGARLDAVRSAATLAKADLTTGMVGEFPELQGVMGRYYALEEGESAAVADAIAEHYAPAGPSDKCPSAPVSVAVALADKIDTLVGFFAIGETPTGSRDPFALRRAAIGVIRLIVENRLRVPLSKAIGWAREAYAGQIEAFAADADKLEQELLEFFADRLKVHLRETGVRHDLISAVFAVRRDDDLVRLLARVDALRAFLGSEDGANLLTAHKRATNIVAIEERKDATTYEGAADAKSMVAGEETALHTRLGKARGAAEDRLAKEDFAGAMRALADLRGPVDAFFDKVTVNAEQRVLRENRLRLLAQIRATMNVVADFSRIEG